MLANPTQDIASARGGDILERVSSLDGVRAIAAIAVVAFHTRLPGFDGGFVGVDVFFVLSGYLITSLLVAELERRGTIDVRSFWWHRIVRLAPALMLFLAVLALLAAVFLPQVDIVAEVLLSGLYISNISYATMELPLLSRHTWSLATEMQFYLLWPFVIVAIRRFAPQRIVPILLTLFLLTTFWRWLQYLQWDTVRAYYAPDTRLSGLALGGLAATVKWRPSRGHAHVMAVAALLVLAVAVNQYTFGTIVAMLWGGAVVELAAAVLILSLRSGAGGIAALLATPALARLGHWSYGLYLWHFPVALVTRALLDPVTAFVLTLGISLPLAAASYLFVEEPVRRLLKRAPASARLHVHNAAE